MSESIKTRPTYDIDNRRKRAKLQQRFTVAWTVDMTLRI